ncbi:DinB family protein [Actinokineospora inagensis]|uniref:DinB family protein n=1 Tax=Actinokineospora inagensis TaxID=103730 RepID=UPI00040CB4FF|nr:DinB family protein [Actinokineospora inagensis]
MTERIGPPTVGAEREVLRGLLDFQRATLELKCEGVSDDDLRRRSCPPSTLTLLGLVRHMAEVERTWFQRVINGEDLPLVWSDHGDFQEAFTVEGASVAEAFTAWRREVARAREIEQAAVSLDVIGYSPRWESDVSLRVVLQHVVSEYARHNGHADFLREAIDGTTGA